MSQLIFDIETIGESWDDLDETTQKSLLRRTDRATSNDEREKLTKEVQESLGLSPLTGEIVAIGILDSEKDKGAVAVFATTGLDVLESHTVLANALFKAIFQDGYTTIGEAISRAKKEVYDNKESYSGDVIDTFVLFGDPATRLKID